MGLMHVASRRDFLTAARIFVPTVIFTLALSSPLHSELSDLSSIAPDLTVPETVLTSPAPGKRVRQTTAGWEGTDVHHTLYLPPDWAAQSTGKKLPVLVEYAGNGNYQNVFGDVSNGSVEGSHMGFGISGGNGFIWICLPYVEIKAGVKSNAVTWWGNIDETKRYCMATVKAVCHDYGGDPQAVVLCGFSRGAIGCNYIGLHDDEIAGLWSAFICHSHYDGVNEKWPYPDADRTSAKTRLQRLHGRPQWISHEMSTADTAVYLQSTGISGDFTFTPIPFRNHSDAWTLRPIPERALVRAWLHRALTR